jgi:hypothetical protein
VKYPNGGSTTTPNIASISPNPVPQNAVVTILGSGFSPTGNILSVGYGQNIAGYKDKNINFTLSSSENGTKITFIPQNYGIVSSTQSTGGGWLTVINAQTGNSNSVELTVVHSTSTLQGNIPPAGYEDEVLTNIETYQNPFPDTDTNQLSGKAAAELYRRAVIGGYPDGQFKGAKNVNRAEAAKFLLLARFGTVADVSNNGQFPDVLDAQWYTPFVVTAAMKGIINGNPDGTFRPADTVNTAEFLKMLSLTFGLQLNMSYSYSDVSSADWFAPYAGIAQKYNLFPSRTSALRPDRPLSRQDVAIAIYQYLVNR